jgi:hypothetical protein
LIQPSVKATVAPHVAGGIIKTSTLCHPVAFDRMKKLRLSSEPVKDVPQFKPRPRSSCRTRQKKPAREGSLDRSTVRALSQDPDLHLASLRAEQEACPSVDVAEAKQLRHR